MSTCTGKLMSTPDSQRALPFSKKCPTPEKAGNWPPECADGPQVLPRALCSGTIPATAFPRLQAAVRANRVMDDPRFRWCGEGAFRPRAAPRIPPALLGRPGQISGVPSRPKHPAQPLVRDVGARPAPPRPAAGTGYFFVNVPGSPHPTSQVAVGGGGGRSGRASRCVRACVCGGDGGAWAQE